MATLQLGSAPAQKVLLVRKIARTTTLAVIALACGLLPHGQAWSAGMRKSRPNPNRPNPNRANPNRANPNRANPNRANPNRADTSSAARQSAVQSIPINRLDDAAKAKVRSVLSDVAVFRRLPIQVVDCDPNLYLFLIQHPDVVVNIWEVLKISSVKLRQTGPNGYQVVEKVGTLANVEFLYRSHDTHLIYAEGTYEGPLFARPVKGRALMVLKSGYVRETNGRYYVTTRLDTFVSVDHGGVELLTKTFHPLVGKTADGNFVQSVAFLGSLSRTAEVNSQGVQRLASKLTHVLPEHRARLAELAAHISQRTQTAKLSKR